MGGTDSRGVALGGVLKHWMLGDDDLRSILQLLKAAGRQLISGVDAFYGRHAMIGNARVDVLHLRRTVGDDINERCLPVVLNGGSRNQGHAMLRGNEQAGIHELIREQAVVTVIKESTKLDGAGGGIDLVIQGEQFAGG